MSNAIHPTKIRQVFLISVIVLLGALLFREMTFMINGFLGAITLYALLRNPMVFLCARFRLRKWAAALIMMLISLVFIVLPFVWMGDQLFTRLEPFLNTTFLENTFYNISDYLKQKFHIDILDKEIISQVSTKASALVPVILSSTFSIFTGLLIAYFLLFYMFTNHRVIDLWIRNNLPVSRSNRKKIEKEINTIVKGNAIGIPLLALVQGGVAALGYWIFGAPEPVLWGVITAICSVIPVIGVLAAYGPLGIYLLSTGDTYSGVAVLLYGFVVVGLSDNVVRFMLQKKLAHVHPIITVFGVIIGINIFGFIGVVFGPLLISLFLLLLKIYKDEFVRKSYKIEDTKPQA